MRYTWWTLLRDLLGCFVIGFYAKIIGVSLAASALAVTGSVIVASVVYWVTAVFVAVVAVMSWMLVRFLWLLAADRRRSVVVD